MGGGKNGERSETLTLFFVNEFLAVAAPTFANSGNTKRSGTNRMVP
jgi:hypothetical protein